MHSLKQMLSCFSTRRVLELLHEYYYNCKNPSNAKNIMQLENLQLNVTEYSIGIEHLIREIGQVYESQLEINKKHPVYSLLPIAAAELLIKGYPIELMDGDASHIPLIWVTAILHEAAEILKNPKVFVFSVLGLQNTGKSTMLNTIFGLQFKVAGGKCTCGAFMQLVEMDEELTSRTGCQYVLVIDTEGLRAPAVDSLKRQRHDNELATLVIGLGDVILINIYGVITGDIDDILQTSVHAFLRMTEVNLSPSCRFIHQNAESTIKDKMGREQLIQKLDKMSKTVAEKEHICARKIEKFSHVLHFNGETDIHCFPALYSGNPPMAPINVGYTEAAQNLKLELISDMCKRSSLSETSCGIPMTSFISKVSDVWNGLLKENFIFSFKNTLEMSAYNELELEYIKWESIYQDAMIKWEQEAENQINSIALESCHEMLKSKLSDLDEVLLKNYEIIQEKMESFFSGSNKEVLIQWKSKFEIRLKELKSEFYSHLFEFCCNVQENRKSSANFEAEKKENLSNMKKIIKACVEKKRNHGELKFQIDKGTLSPEQMCQLRQENIFSDQNLNVYVSRKIITNEKRDEIRVSLSQDNSDENLVNLLASLKDEEFEKIFNEDEELEVQFDKIWNRHGLVNHKIRATSRRIPVQYEVEKALAKYVGPKDEKRLSDKLSKRELRDWSIGQISELFSSFDWQTEFKEHISSKVEQCLEDIRSKRSDFHLTYVYELLKVVDNTTYKYLYDKNITQDFKYDLYLSVCGYALSDFEKMAKSYEEEIVKGPLFIIFKNQYQQTEAEVAIADTLCAYIYCPVKREVQRLVANRMPDFLAASEKYFRDEKAMKGKILMDLLENECNEDFEDYIDNPSGYTERKLREFVKKSCDQNVLCGSTMLQEVLLETLSSLIHDIQEIIVNADAVDLNEWLFTVCATIGSKVGVNLSISEILAENDLKNTSTITDLQHSISNSIHMLEKKLKAHFAEILYVQMDWINATPAEKLKRKVIGCTDVCPFCGEQCDLLTIGHKQQHNQDHRTEFHRMICVNKWSTKRNRIFSSSRKMTMEFCPVLLSTNNKFTTKDRRSHTFSDYKSIYEDWSIKPDMKYKSSLFWAWFLAKHSDSLASRNCAVLPEIPYEWIEIKKESVKKSLEDLYDLTKKEAQN